ncbi:MAG: NAD(P)-binding domain-containing protein [Gammaproteobacteria bacterium]|nr:NAD(P)-binding domain-containing protein [Gammaproteobacteria bacterium]
MADVSNRIAERQPLRLVAIGGLGLMLSPAAGHLGATGPARFLRIHDRGQQDERRDQARRAWCNQGTELVGEFEALVGDGDFDGVVICAGKNGDDLQILRALLPQLARCPAPPFILHLSTVSPGFVHAALEAAESLGIDYVNYPLTGGPAGAEQASMLILACGNRALYQRLEPLLQALGQPDYLGTQPARGAEIKLINHYLVFGGLHNITTAATLVATTLGASIDDAAVVKILDFLGEGVGGTRQWALSLRQGLDQGLWNRGFMLDHATIDALYALQMGVEKNLPIGALRPLADLILMFAYLLQHHPKERLATQAVIRVMQPESQQGLNQFFCRHDTPMTGRTLELLESRLLALPANLRGRVGLNVSAADLLP